MGLLNIMISYNSEIDINNILSGSLLFLCQNNIRHARRQKESMNMSSFIMKKEETDLREEEEKSILLFINLYIIIFVLSHTILSVLNESFFNEFVI